MLIWIIMEKMGWYDSKTQKRASIAIQSIKESLFVSVCRVVVVVVVFHLFGTYKTEFWCYDAWPITEWIVWSLPPWFRPVSLSHAPLRLHEKNFPFMSVCVCVLLWIAVDDLYINRVPFDRYRFRFKWENINQKKKVSTTKKHKKLIRTFTRWNNVKI